MKVFAALQLSKGSAIPIQKLGRLHVAEQVANGGTYDPHGGSDFSLGKLRRATKPKGDPSGAGDLAADAQRTGCPPAPASESGTCHC